ncbi:MAG TPA: biopolymer transporter ExbD [Pyrinomonadaceae bacterium]|nr:biopolymer transporter ExbD [Pyrinomonadaceae bacterium]
MRRTYLHILVALVTLVAGNTFHRQVVNAADFLLTYDSVVLEEPEPSLADSPEPTCTFWNSDAIVISMPADRSLYLGRQFVGTADDTRELEQQLAGSFAAQDTKFYEAQTTDLSKAIRLRDERVVYIKAFGNSSYGDILRLIEAAKRAGALHIGLMAEWRKSEGPCAGHFRGDVVVSS